MTPQKHKKAIGFLVVGGGRWARIIASTLQSMKLPFNYMSVVSKYGFIHSLDRQNFSLNSKIPTNFLPNIPEFLKEDKPIGAVIVNSTHLHFETAKLLLSKKINVLIEKPIASNLAQAIELVEIAKTNNVILMPALNYLHCSYLHNFSRLFLPYHRKPLSFSISWKDPLLENRYGEIKYYDESVNIGLDVLPHIWSILKIAFPQEDFAISDCKLIKGGIGVIFTVNSQLVQGTILLERGSQSRERTFSVHADTVNKYKLDFSIEPGIIDENSKTYLADCNWGLNPKPVQIQIQEFLKSIQKNKSLNAIHLSNSIACMKFTDIGSNLISRAQKEILWRKDAWSNINTDKIYAAKELCKSYIATNGLIQPGDKIALEKKSEDLLSIFFPPNSRPE